MATKFHKEEFPLNTLDPEELTFQFKVMRALGYRSLFDPAFRREIRNPLRRLLYYKLVLLEENGERKFLKSGLEYVADRVGFFSDPELFRKFKDMEARERLFKEGIPQQEIDEKQAVLDKERVRHDIPENTKVEISDFLSK